MDLAQLHKEYQKTAKNERREEAAHALQQQRQAIESLTNQNEVLKNELTIEDRQAKAGKPSPKKKKGGKKKGCKGAAACRNCTAPESNTCGGALFDGADMQRAMGRWVVANGYGGVLIFQVNYDRDNYLLNALGEGLLAAEYQ